MTDELKLRFLIVDDEQSIRRLCITVGQGLGYLCAEAETAEAALETLETSAPDHGGDGFEAAQPFRRRTAAKN